MIPESPPQFQPILLTFVILVWFPIRACYPQVALRDGSAHMMAIGDIVEPVEEWRKLKFEKLKRRWDYVFWRLFYTFTDDIRTTGFRPPIEIDTVEETCGYIRNLDMYIDGTGAPQGSIGLEPSFGRFHIDSAGVLYVIVAGTAIDRGHRIFGNYLGRIRPGKGEPKFERVGLKHPFRSFFTNTPRAGSIICHL